jgi:hypothetical protein
LGSVPDAGRREGLHPKDGPITLRLASKGGPDSRFFPPISGISSSFPLQSRFRRENDELNQFLAGEFPLQREPGIRAGLTGN